MGTHFKVRGGSRSAAAILATGLLCASLAHAQAQPQPSDPARESIGPMYRIEEPDMLEAIQSKLQAMEKSGALHKKMDEGKERALHTAENPKPVAGLDAARVNRTYYFDPSVQMDRDVKDHKGQVVVAAGTRVNPFSYASLNSWLIFFDATVPKQVEMAHRLGEKYGWNVKPILVNGAPLDLTRKWKRRVFFDQGGYLVGKFGITSVPALVTQEGNVFRIDELKY